MDDCKMLWKKPGTQIKPRFEKMNKSEEPDKQSPVNLNQASDTNISYNRMNQPNEVVSNSNLTEDKKHHIVYNIDADEDDVKDEKFMLDIAKSQSSDEDEPK